MQGVLEDYPGLSSHEAGDWIATRMLPAEFFYIGTPEASVRDIQKMQKLSKAVSEMLDAAS